MAEVAEPPTQKPGEVCRSCEEIWKTKGKPPKILQRFKNTTANHHIIVAVCEWCDGSALRLSRVADEKGLHEWPLPDDLEYDDS